MDKNKVLFTTNVGSHLWRMERPESDFDLFRCYVTPTADILRGRVHLVPNSPDTPNDGDQIVDGNSHFSAGGKTESKTDVSSHELNKVVNEVLKNNANFLWGVFSPIVVDVHDPAWLKELQRLSLDCASKVLYHPIAGMAHHNKAKYFDSGKDKGWRRDKTANTIVRTCNFGVAMLEGRGPVFEPSTGNDEASVEAALVRLKAARDASKLPDRPTPEAEAALREFLYATRMRELQGTL